MSSRATEAIEGRASPRNPKVPISERSPMGSLEVAWRSTAKRQILGIHADAVVADPNQRASAAFDAYLDPLGAGIDRVLDEFLDGRGRPLDHLARGDAVDEYGIEAPDVHWRRPSDGFRTS